MDFEQLKYRSALDEDSFRSIMETYGQEVWNYVFALTRNRHDTDDIVQDAFLKCYRSIDSFRGQSAFRTWLFSIARNTAFNVRKSAYWRRVIPSSRLFNGGHYRVPSSPSAEDTMLRNLIEGTIWETLMKLPEKYREILVLDAVYELKQQEISQLLNISVGGVKSRLNRARGKMNILLKGERTHDEAWSSD
ncbi:RNA polymerase sigma factor [Cohnella mopanensis]|uniref:RNA polymerase sigma factor n=1 Tax=Cohnella mopanensis TaxID=2911966 RepID=UPI001EF9AC8E|nr:RNA polymerase sigma factor [Cohnella mopanensis]